MNGRWSASGCLRVLPAARRRTLLAASLLALAGCGGDSDSVPVPAPPANDPGFVTSGLYEMRYGILPARELPREVATAYGIQRSPGRVVVSVSVLRRTPGSTPQPLAASVTGTRRGLLGDAVALDFREVLADSSTSYIAEFEAADREPVVIELQASPSDATAELRARVTRSFEL